MEEAESTMRWESSEQILRDLLEPDLDDLLDHHNRLDELREEIRDRDDTDLITDLITDLQTVSPSSLFRYDLDVDVPDYTMNAQERADACAEIIRVAGLDSDQRTVEEIYDLIDDASYGGHLCVLWSTHPDEAIALAEPVGCDEHGKELTEPRGTVTFTDAHLVILDNRNGSGNEIQLPTITADRGPRRVVIDSPRIGHGYSWTDIAGPGRCAYQATYTIDRPQSTGQPRISGNPIAPTSSAAAGPDRHHTLGAVCPGLPTADTAVGADARQADVTSQPAPRSTGLPH